MFSVEQKILKSTKKYKGPQIAEAILRGKKNKANV